jgi:hypothetical protein
MIVQYSLSNKDSYECSTNCDKQNAETFVQWVSGMTKLDKAKNFIKKTWAKRVMVEFTDLIRWELNVIAGFFNTKWILFLRSLCLLLMFKTQQDAAFRIK